MNDIVRRHTERLEHEALAPRSSALWGHLPTCLVCLQQRIDAGETTTEDLLLVDYNGRPLVDALTRNTGQTTSR